MHSPAYLTARRELRERSRSRAFQASTGIQVLIVVIVVILNAALGGDDTERFDVATVQTPISAPRIDKVKLTFKAYPTLPAARQALADEKVEAVFTRDRILVAKDTDTTLVAVLQILSQRAPPIPVTTVGGKSKDEGTGLAFAATLLLYIAILTFGYVVAGGVVEEKSSRVVEVILSAIRPLQLLTGKVIGIGILGLAQLVLIAGFGLLAASLVGSGVDLPSSTAATAVVVVVYFLLGYAFYASAYAAAGSLVSRTEDIQSVTAPLLGLVIASYFVALAVLNEPDGKLATVTSFIPISAPMVVPARAARDALPGWQLALSIALMIVAVVLVMRLAAGVYERSILRLGAPVKLREALRGRSNG